MADILTHYGVKGMRWGIRKASPRATTRSRAGKKIDVVKQAMNKASEKAKQKQAEKFEKNKEKIKKSPTKLYRNRDKFTDEEILTAMKDIRMERELRSLSRDEITTGSQYASAVLSYGTAAVAAYNIYKSPLGQAITDQLKG